MPKADILVRAGRQQGSAGEPPAPRARGAKVFTENVRHLGSHLLAEKTAARSDQKHWRLEDARGGLGEAVNAFAGLRY